MKLKQTLTACLGLSMILGFSDLSLASGRQSWSFATSSGLPMAVTLNGAVSACAPEAANNLQIASSKVLLSATVCLDDQSRPNHYLGYATLPNGEVMGFYLYAGAEFTAIMQQIYQFGNPGGSIGNAVQGKCPGNTKAFLSINGSYLGDSSSVGGYCLFDQ